MQEGSQGQWQGSTMPPWVHAGGISPRDMLLQKEGLSWWYRQGRKEGWMHRWRE